MRGGRDGHVALERGIDHLVLLHPALAAECSAYNDCFKMLTITPYIDKFTRQVVLNVSFHVFRLEHKRV